MGSRDILIEKFPRPGEPASEAPLTLTVLRDESLLKLLSKKQLECFKLVSKVLLKAGYEARLVGGAVRDLLSGVEPDDIDVATTALPEDVTKLFSGYYRPD